MITEHRESIPEDESSLLQAGGIENLNSPTMLVVDDTPSIRRRIREILEDGGYNVVGEAEDGDEAIEMAKKLKPDIIIMDYVMRRVDGIEATHKIKNMHQDAKIIIVTQSPSPSVVVDSMKAGAINFVIKPFQDRQLLNVIRNAIET